VESVRPFSNGLMRQSILTGLAACLFTGGVVVLFLALFHEASRGGPLLWIAAVLLIATLVCWIASARAGEREG
jgi:hypothetical protein